MKASLDARTIPGWLAVAAMLLLTSPGVRTVRADADVLVSEVPDGPSCSGRAEVENIEADLARYIEEARRAAAAQPDAGADYVVLNNRGYNYGPARTPSLHDVAVDARLEQ
jgi:hypothetical protein